VNVYYSASKINLNRIKNIRLFLKDIYPKLEQTTFHIHQKFFQLVS